MLTTAAPAGAGEMVPLADAGSFAAATEGWTIHYGLMGLHFGSEQYFPGGTVLWRAAGAETCLHGTWEVENGLICFTYEDDPEDRKCWGVGLSDGRLSAWLPQSDDGAALVEASRDRAPLDCPAPGLGA